MGQQLLQVSQSVSISSKKLTAFCGIARSVWRRKQRAVIGQIYSCVGKDYEQLFAKLEKLKASKEGGRYFVWISNREKRFSSGLSLLWWRICPYHLLTAPILATLHGWSTCIFVQTLRCHILELLSVVKETIQAELPPKFIIVLDGWTEGTHHYIGISAAYLKVGADCKEVPVQTMLSMKPLLVDRIDGMQASDHLDHVEKVLESYS